MTKQDIIKRLKTAAYFGGSWAFAKAQGRISNRFGIYEISDYPSNRYEVVYISNRGDDIYMSNLWTTESLKEAIDCYAEMVAN